MYQKTQNIKTYIFCISDSLIAGEYARHRAGRQKDVGLRFCGDFQQGRGAARNQAYPLFKIKTKGCAPKLKRTAFLNAFSDEVNYFSQTTFPLNI